MTHPDPGNIMAFLEVVRHGSFRAAARALGWSKSSVSQRVAELEAQLGARLLARTTRSVQLTDIGRSYQRDAAAAFDALREADARVREQQARPSGRLRLTAPVELGQALLGDVLAHYAQRYPEVELEVSLTDRVVNLIEDGFDLAIRVGPLGSSGLIARVLSDPQPLGVYASPAYLKRSGTPRQPSDLAAHRCLVMSGAQAPGSWTFLVEGKPRSVTIHPHIAINSFQVLSALAAAGVGIARLPARHAAEGVASGQLKLLLKAFALPPRNSVVVYPSSRNVSPALRAMIDVLVERYGEHLK